MLEERRRYCRIPQLGELRTIHRRSLGDVDRPDELYIITHMDQHYMPATNTFLVSMIGELASLYSKYGSLLSQARVGEVIRKLKSHKATKMVVVLGAISDEASSAGKGLGYI